MPRATRSKTQASAQRPAPYHHNRTVSSGQPHTMAAVVSPMISYGYNTPHPYYLHDGLDHQQQQQLNHYHDAIQTQYTAIPTPLTGAPPVQHINTPMMPVQSSRTDHNSTSGWTDQMDEILWNHQKKLKWDVIAAKFFTNKTGNACRKRFARLKKEREEPARWEKEKIEKVAEVYRSVEMRRRIWQPVADAVGEHWATWEAVEKCCYHQGLRSLTSSTPYTHSRRQSRAVSHRSHQSINSDQGHNIGYEEEEPTDDSGLGGDVHGTHSLLQLQSHDYAVREDYGGLQPESYYRYDR